MKSIEISVGPRTDGTWCVRRSDSSRPCAIMPTRGEALAIGRALAQSVSGSLEVVMEPEAVRRTLRARHGSSVSR